MNPIQLPRELVWRGYRLLKREDVLECDHQGVILRVFNKVNDPERLFATITVGGFVGTGEGETEKKALAESLKNVKSRLLTSVREGKQAERDLERLRMMF